MSFDRHRAPEGMDPVPGADPLTVAIFQPWAPAQTHWYLQKPLLCYSGVTKEAPSQLALRELRQQHTEQALARGKDGSLSLLGNNALGYGPEQNLQKLSEELV